MGWCLWDWTIVHFSHCLRFFMRTNSSFLMCRKNKLESLDLLQLKNKSHNPLGCKNYALGCPDFQHINVCDNYCSAEANWVNAYEFIKPSPFWYPLQIWASSVGGVGVLTGSWEITKELFLGDIQRYLDVYQSWAQTLRAAFFFSFLWLFRGCGLEIEILSVCPVFMHNISSLWNHLLS